MRFCATILLIFVCLLAGCVPDSASVKRYDGHYDYVADENTVYICTGPTAEVYHRRWNCRGLDRCSGEVIPVDLDDVIDSRRPCRICCY